MVCTSVDNSILVIWKDEHFPYHPAISYSSSEKVLHFLAVLSYMKIVLL
jgi:hypothetical protein